MRLWIARNGSTQVPQEWRDEILWVPENRIGRREAHDPWAERPWKAWRDERISRLAGDVGSGDVDKAQVGQELLIPWHHGVRAVALV